MNCSGVFIWTPHPGQNTSTASTVHTQTETRRRERDARPRWSTYATNPTPARPGRSGMSHLRLNGDGERFSGGRAGNGEHLRLSHCASDTNIHGASAQAKRAEACMLKGARRGREGEGCACGPSACGPARRVHFAPSSSCLPWRRQASRAAGLLPSSTFFYLLYFFFLPPLASPGFSGGGSHGAAKSRYRISFSSSP